MIASISRQLVRAAFALRAVLAATVRAVHRRHQFRQLRRFLRIRRRRHRQRVLEDGELALLFGCRVLRVEGRCALGEIRDGGGVRLGRARRHRLGVGRDVRRLRPAGLAGLVAQTQERGVRVVEEGLEIGVGSVTGRCGLPARHERGQQEDRCDHT